MIHTRTTIFLAVALFIALVIGNSFLTESLWLDETITYWVTRDSFWDVVSRSVTYQGQSPLFYIVIWISQKVLGSSELALRIPSVCALILTSFVFYKFARKLLGQESASLAVILLFAQSSLLKSMSARPYSFALLGAILSVFILLCWIEERRRSLLILYVLSTLFAFYSHYLFLGILGVHLLLFWAWSGEWKARGVQFACALASIGVLSAPGLVQMFSLYQRREGLFFAPPPGALLVAEAIFPPLVVIATCGGLLLAKILFREIKFTTVDSLSYKQVLALVLWGVVPPLFFLGYSFVATGSLFNERYFLWYSFSIALLGALVVKLIHPERIRSFASAFVVLFLILGESERRWQVEDWRSAAVILNEALAHDPETQIVVSTGLIESANLEWLKDPAQMPYLLSPLGYYHVAGNVTLLPARVDTEAASTYLSSNLELALYHKNSMLLIYLRPLDLKLKGALDSALKQLDASREIVMDGVVRVERITRSS